MNKRNLFDYFKKCGQTHLLDNEPYYQHTIDDLANYSINTVTEETVETAPVQIADFDTYDCLECQGLGQVEKVNEGTTWCQDCHNCKGVGYVLGYEHDEHLHIVKLEKVHKDAKYMYSKRKTTL